MPPSSQPSDLAALPESITLRRGTPDDMLACHAVLWQAINSLAKLRNLSLDGTADDWWPGAEPEQRFLARTAAEWWVAEDRTSGALIGYARSIERGGLLELTEFFVEPGQQSRGVGRALLSRVFPVGRGEVRSIIATTDVRALGRYYAADTAARSPLLTATGAPVARADSGVLEIVRVESVYSARLGDVQAIERAVLGYPRGTDDLRWILERREGYVYRRDGQAVGFAFVGKEGAGPIAALQPANLAPVLDHVESRAQALGVDRLSLQVPGENAVAMRHLVSHGFKIEEWVNLLMSNRPFGAFDRFLPFSPTFL